MCRGTKISAISASGPTKSAAMPHPPAERPLAEASARVAKIEPIQITSAQIAWEESVFTAASLDNRRSLPTLGDDTDATSSSCW